MDLNNVNNLDEEIYMQENRYDKPKEQFKFALKLIHEKCQLESLELLDMGCATGEFIFHILKYHPEWNCSGIDISREMVAQASEKVPNATFTASSILNSRRVEDRRFDWVTCLGVLTHFDEPEITINKLLSYLKPGGFLLFTMNMTRAPIDVMVRYRRADNEETSSWETGWNMFSRETIEQVLKKSSYGLSWSWHEFLIPFNLPRQENPMRCWTIPIGGRNRQLVNGASQIIDIWFARIKVDKLPD